MSAKKLNTKAKGGISTYSVNSTASGVLDDRINIVSDEIGNPIEMGEIQYRWNGRQLQGISIDGTEVLTYAYNTDGQRTKKVFSLPDDGICHTYEYFYNGSILAGQKVIKVENGEETTYTLAFMYDNNGDIFGFYYNDTPYYYIKNAQNDVVMVVNTDGVAEILYFYDAWGNISNCYEMPGSNMSEINPLTYRSYYYDAELSMYYLNSRYYMPTLCRFLNADGLIDNREIYTQNLFQYCANNPVNNIDSNGRAWYHWAIAAAVGAACAVAVVATAGGAAAAIGAVASVACGGVAATAASTVAAGAFIGASVVLGAAAVGASMNSSSAKDFANQGNWGTVAATVGGAAAGAVGGYGLSGGAKKTPVIGKMQDLNKVKININEFKVADLLPDMGSAKANWHQNSGVLRSFLDGRPIRDVSPYPMDKAGFLGMERNLLVNQGYVYEEGYWIMP